MHPVHNVKKRVASATAKKKVQKDIGEEFLEYKKLLLSLQNALNGYCKSVDESVNAYSNLFKVQLDFVSSMTASYPRSDPIRSTSQQYAANLTALQSNVTLSDSADKPFKVLHRTVLKYLQEIADIQNTYAEVELTYSEYLRYTQKSDRLVARKNRNEAKIERNVEKREKSRVEYHAKLDATVSSMKAIWDKHPVVFQIAMCSFWLRNDQTVRLFSDHAAQMHSEADSFKLALLDVDLSQPQSYVTLLPTPTNVPLITYPPSSAPEHLQIMPSPAVQQASPHACAPPVVPQVPSPQAQQPLPGYPVYPAASTQAIPLPPARNPEVAPPTPPAFMPPLAAAAIAPPPIVNMDSRLTEGSEARPAKSSRPVPA